MINLRFYFDEYKRQLAEIRIFIQSVELQKDVISEIEFYEKQGEKKLNLSLQYSKIIKQVVETPIQYNAVIISIYGCFEQYMLDMMTEAGLKEELPNQMSEMIRINQNKYIDAQSIRMPQNRKRVRQQSVTEIETLTEEDLYNLKKVYEKEAKNPYSKKITKQYIKTLIGNRHELSSAEVPLETKEDLLMILSAAAYAEENGFKIEIEEGYFEAGKMVLRSFRILEV